MKYHVNPETGEVGQCRARVNCRFGVSAEEHHATPDDARAAYEKTKESFSKSNDQIAKSISYGSEDHNLKMREAVVADLEAADRAKTPLVASQNQWYALSRGGKGEGQDAIYKKFKDSVADHEKNWKAGEKFDSKIEGKISLTNKVGLVTDEKPGFYTTSSGDYNVYRRGAGPATAFVRNKENKGWAVSSGPGSDRFLAKNKAQARKAAVAIHDLELSRKVGKWVGSTSVAEAVETMKKTSSLAAPNSFYHDSLPSTIKSFERFQ